MAKALLRQNHDLPNKALAVGKYRHGVTPRRRLLFDSRMGSNRAMYQAFLLPYLSGRFPTIHSVVWAFVAIQFFCGTPMPAQDELSQQAIAIFRERCISCHGEKTQESELRLDQSAGALRGGDGGRVIVVGKSDSSELIRRVASTDADERMPPEGTQLTADEIGILSRWIVAGAHWPEALAGKTVWSDDRLQHWAWQPIARVAPPAAIGDPDWMHSEIDRFVFSKLREHGLRPAPLADRATLIRRLTFDLIGLPPTPDEVRSFVADNDPQAYENLVDGLLASPRYGERWARHWLDVVHYADTHGYDKDQPRPNAWPYRDYVIRAFNEDKPYSQFIAEQIAGDVLYPETRDGIEALGFIAAGPWDLIGHAEVPETKIDGQIARHLDRDDMVANTLGTFCSVTVHCAQCHDHKFDPITQDDYYSLQTVFAALDRADRTVYLGAENQRCADELAITKRELEAKIAVLKATLTENKNDDAAESKAEIKSLKTALVKLDAELSALPNRFTVYCGTVHHGSGNFCGTGASNGKPRLIHVLNRGNVEQPGTVANPGALSLLAMLPARFVLPPEHSERDRRAALAKWLCDSENPLTWRSIVNRVWQQHFGQGIVDTANDFGRMGSPPSHDQLLDWLAADFRDHGGSFKRLHKQIVISAVYRQQSKATSSEIAEQAIAVDADNRFLWRQNRRKLDAESLHDSVLAASGNLDLNMGGPGYQDFVIEQPEHSPHYEYSKADPRDPSCFRRAIYRFAVRSQTQPFMTCLDCADPSMRVAKRNESVSPLQALTLLNNGFMLTQSEFFAARLRTEAGNEVPAQVDLAAQLVWGRLPSTDEQQTLVAFAQEQGLESLCRALFNSSEFVFVD